MGFMSMISSILVNCIFLGGLVHDFLYSTSSSFLVHSPEASVFYIELIFEASVPRGP